MRTPEGEDVWFRSAMSAGNLHPVEMYVISDALGGVYHYDPLGHELALVRPRRRRNGDDDGGITVVLSGVPLRTCWRYGARGWRHLWWDAGTVLANILAVSDAHGLDAGLVTSFADADVSEVIGCESVDEVPLVVVRLGPPGGCGRRRRNWRPEPSMPVQFAAAGDAAGGCLPIGGQPDGAGPQRVAPRRSGAGSGGPGTGRSL